MPVELVILAFITLIVLCMVDPKHYFLVTFAGMAMITVFRHNRSRFTDGDTEDMKLGDTLEDNGLYGDLTTISSDLDSSAEIDALLNRTPISDGDELLYTAMRGVQDKSKEAVLNRARWTSDNARKYFQEELDSAEQQHWWEDDSLVENTVKDGVHYESDNWTDFDS